MNSKPKMVLWTLSVFAMLLTTASSALAQQEITLSNATLTVNDLEIGDNTTTILNIANAGDADLNWSVALEDVYGRGPAVGFEKVNFASWLLPANQDRISDYLWIARNDNQSIFNARSETSSDNNSPADSEWALGGYNDVSTFVTFKTMHGNDPGSLVGQVTTLHDINDGKYYEVEFSNWSGSNTGGGFAYDRYLMTEYVGLVGSASGTITAGLDEDVTISINTTSLAPGSYTANLVVTSNDADEGTIIVPINIDILEAPTFELSATSFSEALTTGDDETTQILTIANNGASTLIWDTDGTNQRPRDMSGVTLSAFNGSVPTGETRDIEIYFAEDGNSEGSYDWPLTFSSNDPTNDEVVVTISLDITGEALIDYSTPDYNTTFVGSTSSEELTIYNEGTAVLVVSNITSSATQFVSTATTLSIEPGESEDVAILFSPDAAGTFNTDITINSNDSETPLLVLSLSGEAVEAPSMTVSPLSFTNSISTSDNPTNAVTVNNSGAGDLEWVINMSAGALSPQGTTFQKENYEDETLEANQDRIATEVWITRAENDGVFNAFEESSYSGSTSTIEWALGKTADATPADYTSFKDAFNGNVGNNILGSTLSLHLIDENRYFDVEFSFWQRNRNGGGFAYTRKEVKQWLSVATEPIEENVENITASSASTVFDLEIDGSVMFQGDFTGTATISSNDPLEPEQVITFNVSVTGTPDITETPNTASISAIVGSSEIIEVPIVNDGDGILAVSNVTSNNSMLVPSETSFSVGPFETYVLEATFSPIAVQSDDIDLTISSDDPVSSSFVIDVTAEGLEAPSIGFSATAFNATIEAGNSTTQSLTISNSGDGDLDWGIEEVYFSKANGADFSKEENQDRIYEDVWITRRDYEPIFNYFETTDYNSNSETIMYGDGETNSLSFNDYSPDFKDALDECGSCLEGNTLSLYLVDYDEYYDLAIDFWQSDEQGGGFTYTRRLASPWLTFDSYGDNLGTEGTSVIDVTFDASNLNAGMYEFEYEIESNDPANPTTTITFMLEVTGTPNLSVSEGSTLNLGDEFIDNISTGSLIVQNTGSDDLAISNIQFDDAAFSIAETAADIAPGETTIFDFTFLPTAEQAYNATGTITSNDPDGDATFSVSGTGVATPDVSIDVSSIDVELLSGGLVEKSFTITNNGLSSVEWEIDRIVLAGSDEVLFEKADYADWTLAENQDRVSENVWITRADEQGLFNAALENSYTNGDRRRALEAIEVPEIDAFDASPHGTLWASGRTLDENNYESWRDAIDGNAADLPGEFLSMWLVEDDKYYDVEFLSWTGGDGEGSTSGGGFAYRRQETVTWLNGFSSSGDEIDSEGFEDVTFNVNAEGVSAGEYDATIVVSDGLNTQNIAVTLTVLGLPEIAVSDEAIDFETVFVGDSETIEFEIENNGLATLNISNISSNESAFTSNSVSSIAIGETAIVEVTFAPSDAISYNGVLTIASDDPTSSTLAINVSGTGATPPELNLDKTSLDQTLFFGASESQTFTISNTGNADLEWNLGVSGGTVEFTRPDNADWTLEENQDRIKEDIWITRANTRGIFNIAQEDENDREVSPIGTFWAYGPTGETGEGGEGPCCIEVIDRAALVAVAPNEDYSDWRDVVGGDPDNDDVYSMYLSDHDLYYDVVFTYWAKGNDDGQGSTGGFTYQRTPSFYEYNAVSFSATEGVVAPGQSQEVTVFFNPTGTFDGRFELPLQVESNDPSGPIEIPLSLNVNGIIVENPIEDQLINEGFGTEAFDITNMFADAQDDQLSYMVESSDGAVASAVESGDMLTVTEVGTGTTVITITAEDGKGSSDSYDFDFRVNAIPVVSSGIADQTYENSFGTDAIDIASSFSDADAGDVLSYSASTSANGVVDLSIANGTLTISEVGPGTVNVTVTADDGFGGEISDVFEVVVNKIDQTISFNALTTVSEDVGTVALSASASSGLAVTFESSNTSIASVSGSTLTIVGAGQVDITASQAGNDEYSAASPVSQSLTVEAVLSTDNLESVEIYPNPVENFLSVSNKSASKIEIYHLDGKLVLSQEISEKADLSDLNQGVYLIKLKDKNDTEIYSGRLVKN